MEDDEDIPDDEGVPDNKDMPDNEDIPDNSLEASVLSDTSDSSLDEDFTSIKKNGWREPK